MARLTHISPHLLHEVVLHGLLLVPPIACLLSSPGLLSAASLALPARGRHPCLPDSCRSLRLLLLTVVVACPGHGSGLQEKNAISLFHHLSCTPESGASSTVKLNCRSSSHQLPPVIRVAAVSCRACRLLSRARPP